MGPSSGASPNRGRNLQFGAAEIERDPSAQVRIAQYPFPAGLKIVEYDRYREDREEIGRTLAAQPCVSEVHDLHVWEISSGFPALTAHVLVSVDCDCHATRRRLADVLTERFGIGHTTLQVEHAQPPQALQIAATRPQSQKR